MIMLLVVLVVIGIVLSLVRGWVDPTVYKLCIILIVLAVVLIILNAFGLVPLPAAFQLKGSR